jgi:hypothetical protein
MELAWALWGETSRAAYRAARETFIEVFRLRQSEPVQLVFEIEAGRKRAADVYVDGQLLFTDGVGQFERVSGTFRAADWRLYDPAMKVVEFALADAEGLPIPFTEPIPIGRSDLDIIQSISYASGSRLAAIEWPVIVINGPLNDPIIQNITTGEQIDLTGLSLLVGEFVVVDLSGGARRDYKTIRNQDGDSVTQFLSVDSDLATWHLSYAGELLSNGTYSTGTNEIRVIGSGATLQSVVSIRYYDRYEGI